MSSLVLPALPIVNVEPSVTPTYRTTVHETIGGKKQKTAWWSTPINRYKLRWDALRASVYCASPWGAYTEPGLIRYFYDAHRGDWDSWLMNDPFTGSQVRVAFIADSLVFTQVVPGVWSAEAEVETVK